MKKRLFFIVLGSLSVIMLLGCDVLSDFIEPEQPILETPIVQELHAVSIEEGIRLEWASVDQAVSYTLYRATQSHFIVSQTEVFYEAESPFVDTGLDPNQRYYYRVTYHQQKGSKRVESDPSPVVSEQPLAPPSVLSVPVGLLYDYNTFGELTLQWDAVPLATGYQLHWATGNVTAMSTFSHVSVSTTNYTTYLSEIGDRYTLYVTSTRGLLQSLPSERIIIETYHEYESLFTAVLNEEPSKITALFERGDSPYIHNIDGETPLHVAIALGNTDLIEALLHGQSNGDFTNTAGLTPLIYAIRLGDLASVRLLLENGASPNRVYSGAPVYYESFQLEPPVAGPILSACFDYGAALIKQQLTVSSPLPTLHKLVEGDYRDLVGQVIRSDDSLRKSPDVRGNTPLFYVASEAMFRLLDPFKEMLQSINHDQVSILSGYLSRPIPNRELASLAFEVLGSISDPDQVYRQVLLASVSQEGITTGLDFLFTHGVPISLDLGGQEQALHVLAQVPYDRSGMVATFLIEQGLDPFQKDSTGRYPFHVAIQASQSLVLCDLLKPNDVDAPDAQGQTGLFMTTDTAILTYLLDQGSDINLLDNEGYSPLSWAIRHEKQSIIPFLLLNGADPYQKNHLGMTPLRLAKEVTSMYEWLMGLPMFSESLESAIKAHDSQRVSDFLVQGVDVDVQTVDGFSYVHLAVKEGQSQILEFLIDAGAPIELQDLDGMTPLHHAIQLGDEVCVELLLAHGVDVNVQRLDGAMSLHLAIQSDQDAMVDRLLQIPSLQLDMADNQGFTPVMRTPAQLEHGLDYLKALEQKGAILPGIGNDTGGRSLVHLACDTHYTEMVDYLMDKAVNKTMTDSLGNTLVHYLCREGYSEHLSKISTTQFLNQNLAGFTGLHFAAKADNLSLVNALLSFQKGASELEDESHKLALDYATSPDVLRVLIRSLDNVNQIQKSFCRLLSKPNGALLSDRLDVFLDAHGDALKLGGKGLTAALIAAVSYSDNQYALRRLFSEGWPVTTPIYYISGVESFNNLDLQMGGNLIHYLMCFSSQNAWDVITYLDESLTDEVKMTLARDYDPLGFMPLHYAAISNSYDKVQWCLLLGVDPNALSQFVSEDNYFELFTYGRVEDSFNRPATAYEFTNSEDVKTLLQSYGALIPPPMPYFDCVQSGETISIMWDSDPQATSYTIYGSTQGFQDQFFSVIKSQTDVLGTVSNDQLSFTFHHEGPFQSNTPYYYMIEATNGIHVVSQSILKGCLFE